MTSTHHVHVTAEIAATAAAVWQRVSDHEATPSWVPKVKSVRLERDGDVHNGKGAIRVVQFRPRSWSTIREEITSFDPPRAFEYAIISGMPALRAHRGRVAVAERGAASTLTWDVEFTFGGWHPFRLIVPSFLRTFEAVLAEGLAQLTRQLQMS